ncbi:hypothetical protein [Klebsiella quasipneumoniae]|uniref:hypothetical protein n=1 Tax=Klebsiella quasipneumoniae TaxID=1463165 RepID=UPI001C986BAE|nr:hypothetical protein [Klebsiella quasipneumoniae]MBY5246595.1 hypothetical protein [Klebsiella quasipneumoniae]
MEDNQTHSDQDTIYRISWLGYVRPVLWLLIVTALCSAVMLARDYGSAAMQMQLAHPLFVAVPAAIIALAAVRCALKFYYLYTLRLIINADGVYLFRGIFPWTKGTYGTLWQDIADAQYFPGFIAWVTKTYSVQVRFRFNKSNETFVPYLWNGHRAVMLINQTLQERARNGQSLP